MRNFLTSTTEYSGFERILFVLGQVCTNERWTLINFAMIWVQYYTAPHFFHTISVINSITRSSNRSTLSVYGFWSSPNPNIMHLSSLEKSRLRPERVAPRGASASSSSNCSVKRVYQFVSIIFTYKSTPLQFVVTLLETYLIPVNITYIGCV
jgi:hypothetical protein